MHRSSNLLRGPVVRLLDQELAHTFRRIDDIRARLALMATPRRLMHPACVRLAWELERRSGKELDHAAHLVEQLDYMTLSDEVRRRPGVVAPTEGRSAARIEWELQPGSAAHGMEAIPM